MKPALFVTALLMLTACDEEKQAPDRSPLSGLINRH